MADTRHLIQKVFQNHIMRLRYPRTVKELTRRLVQEFDLQGVISVPAGVFLPYTGSKTSVLVFQRPKDAQAPRTQEVWFYLVEADGFELSQVRRPIPANDLPDVIATWPAREEGPKSWRVSAEDIRGSDYNLTANRYAPARVQAAEQQDPQALIEQVLALEEELAEGLRELLATFGESIAAPEAT